MRAQLASRGKRSRIFTAKTSSAPCCILRAPAIKPKSVDLPTPSGPITPVITPWGIWIETSSKAKSAPYRWLRCCARTTKRPSLDMGMPTTIDQHQVDYHASQLANLRLGKADYQ